MKLNRYSDVLANMLGQHQVIDDFHWYLSPHMWTSLASDSGASVAVVAATDAGILAVETGNTNNNEAMVASTNAAWKFAAGKTVYCEALIQYSEANTDDANVAFGLSSAAAANLLVDDGAGPAADHTAALIFKLDGSTVWKTHTSNGTTQTTSTSVKTAGGSSYQRLGIEMRDVDGTNMEVTFFCDSLPLLDSTFRRPIKHYVAIASATAMKLCVYAKAGGGASEIVNVDYIAILKAR